MKYSFVLPAYKATYFKEAIDSILTQTYKEFELIIVNDASPDDLYSIVMSYDDPRIHYYVNETNIGGKDLVAQWNHSISYAKGEYVILASDDDVYFPHYLEKMDALVSRYPEVQVFRPRIQVIDAQGCINHVYGCLGEKVTQVEYWYHWSSIGSTIGHVLFNRTSLIRRGGFVNFPMAWGSDDASILMMGYNGICFEPDILYSFRNSGLNITSKKINYHTLIRKVEALRMYYCWLKDFLERYDVTSTQDSFYKEANQERLDNLFQALTVNLINRTTFFHALRALPTLINLDYVSVLVVFKRLALRLLNK